jgi:hypothetical protein
MGLAIVFVLNTVDHNARRQPQASSRHRVTVKSVAGNGAKCRSGAGIGKGILGGSSSLRWKPA